MKKKLHGFTLVELLVVISIIAMLIAILVPILARSRLLSSRLACLNNLKQLGIAVETYAMSYKYYPVCVSETDVRWDDFLADKTVANGKMLGVPVSLWPFYLNANLYNCPILSKAGADISYCYNYLAGKKYEIDEPVVEPSYIPPKPKPEEEIENVKTLSPEKVKTPSMFILMYDLPIIKTSNVEKLKALYHDIDPDDYRKVETEEFIPVEKAGPGYLWFKDTDSPHSRGYDLLFGDGHSKWQKKWNDSDMNRSPK